MSRGDTAREVILRDISEMGSGLGLGLEGVAGAEPGDKVTVQLECGGILSGKIIWAKKDKAAIEVMKSYRA
jgi:hypothetical protein